MKTLAVERATAPLSEYVRAVAKGPLLLTVRGRPVAALLDVRDVDTESLSLANNPRFVAIIERSRARLRAEGGIPLAEVRREFGLPASAARRRKAARPGAAQNSERTSPKNGQSRRARRR